MQSNSDLLEALRGVPRAQFYLCDLHVHSPASADVRLGSRFDELGAQEKQLLESISQDAAKNSVEYEKKVEKSFPPSHYYDLLVARRDTIAHQESISEGEDWAIVALTDHNVCSYTCAVAKHAWKHRRKGRLIVLPGIELDIAFSVGDKPVNVHVLLIYQPGTEASDMRVAIREMALGDWSFGDMANVSSLPRFISGVRAHKDYPALAIAAHAASGKGIREETRRVHEQFAFTAMDAAIARTSAEIKQNPEADKEDLKSRLKQLRKERKQATETVSLKALKLIGECGFDALQVSSKEDAIHYRRLHRFHPSFGRAVPIVASDAHRLQDIFVCSHNVSYLKLDILSASSSPPQLFGNLGRALRYGETRFSYSTPGQVTRWISGIEVIPDAADATKFWPPDPRAKSFVLPLSRNLSCLIGGRGSGKSAAIEAIAFVAEPSDFVGKSRERDERLPDWYKRARATLSGCQVRLIWQAMVGAQDLPKGALFASRYFKPRGEHAPVTYTKLGGEEVLESSLSLEAPQLFRTRDVEGIAEPEELRRRFDELVGPEVEDIEAEIRGLLTDLSGQRAEMVATAWRILELTEEDSPLREYARRKAAYQAANRPEVQPYYSRLDKASAAGKIVQGTKKRWEAAVEDANIEESKSEVLRVLSALQKKIKDEEGKTKPCCESLAKLFKRSQNNQSPRKRLQSAFENLQSELESVERLLEEAAEDIATKRRKAREALVKRGLPPGAKDREAKKEEFEEAKSDLEEYREAMQEWQDQITARKELFRKLEAQSKERTRLREKTAERLTAQLKRDLDPSVIEISVQVHAMEDRSGLHAWLSDNVGPVIPKSRSPRLRAIIEKNVMPEDVRNALLGEVQDGTSVFRVKKAKASEGRVEPTLAAKILQECSGKVPLEPEHTGTSFSDKLDKRFVAKLPKEIREGLWTFPRTSDESDDLIIDAVLGLDEVVFDDRAEILLNDRPAEAGSMMRPIGELSPGQRCSAILPILLLNGRSPLIIDQPEDNLDNRLIRQVIVNILASIKLRRQVIIATHNPNLPVLGDVEQAIVLRAVEEKQSQLEWTGDLDAPKTIRHLTDIMEGGREAFQYRQSIYQAHWAGPVSEDQAGQ